MGWKSGGCQLLVLLSLIIGSTGQRGSDLETFLDEVEGFVHQLRDATLLNYEHTCELAADCAAPEKCSRQACTATDRDLQEYQCEPLFNNTRCRGPDGSVCQTGLLTTKRSYVRYAAALYKGIPLEVRDAICATRQLDATMSSLESSQLALDLVYLKFGSIEGIHRAYPGRHLESSQCETYEPRHRLWWNGAISVRKSLVILLDNGASMGRLAGVSPPTSAFALGQQAVLRLLPTMTAADEASVVLFSGAGVLHLNSDRTFVVPGTGLEVDNEDLISLSSAVNGAALSDDEGPSDFAAGMQRALSILSSASPEALKVVIVLTDGRYGDFLNQTEVQPVIQDLLRENVKVLTFAFGQAAATGSLTALACSMGGSFEIVDTPLNPLFGMRSYFSFLARSRLAVVDKPSWHQEYNNYDSLGAVVDVGYAVMSRDGQHLIGVVGSVVPVLELSAVMQGGLNDALVGRIDEYISNPKGANLSCSPRAAWSSCEVSGGVTGLCQASLANRSYTDLFCCASCGGLRAEQAQEEPGKSIVGPVVGGVGGGIFVLLLAVFAYWRWRPRPLPPPPRPSPQPTDRDRRGDSPIKI